MTVPGGEGQGGAQGSGESGNPGGQGGGTGADAAGQPSGDQGSSGATQSGEELVPITRVRELQGTNDRLRHQIGDLSGQLTTHQQQAEVARGERDAAAALALANFRRALLAENAGQIVPELVQGDTPEALEASVQTAKSAFQSAADAARKQIADQRVPGGSGTRDAGAAAGATAPTTPTDKIAAGLRQSREERGG